MVQKLTESRFGISKFGIPIEIRSLMSAGIGCTVVTKAYFTKHKSRGGHALDAVASWRFRHVLPDGTPAVVALDQTVVAGKTAGEATDAQVRCAACRERSSV